MTITAPPSGGHFVVPDWWTDPAFNLAEISTFLGTPISTVSYWLTLARASGIEVGDQSGNRTRYSCADVFALALLAKLRGCHVRVNADVVNAAFAFTSENGRPRQIPYNGMWTVFDDDASLTVPAWLAWTAVRAWATQYFGGAHA